MPALRNAVRCSEPLFIFLYGGFRMTMREASAIVFGIIKHVRLLAVLVAEDEVVLQSSAVDVDPLLFAPAFHFPERTVEISGTAPRSTS